MSEIKPQSYENHSRFPTTFMVCAGLFLVALLVGTIISGAAGFSIGCVASIFLLAITRTYALTLQDRIIRLEMRVRLNQVLPEELRPRIADLQIKQLVALRFASDAELPALVSKVLSENIQSQSDIKRLVQDWQADHHRV